LHSNTREPFKPSEGPTVTAGIVYDRTDGDFKNWFILEDGGYPKELGAVLQLLNLRRRLFREVEIITKDEFLNAFRSASAGKMAATDGASDNTAMFLVMGRDLANGQIRLHSSTDKLDIKWKVPPNRPLYEAERRLSTDFANAMGGDVSMNPLWRLFHIPASVHNLGGCLMANSRDGGVTDANGEVYEYPGLFVLDGSILPKATGVNPSHTIAAVAERDIEAAIRRFTEIRNWRAPEAAFAKPIVDPLESITIPPDGTFPTNAR